MEDFQNSTIWKRTLGGTHEPYAEQRVRLRAAFMALRSRAEKLASEIALDLPQLTVHDLTHLDALWGMADLIVGPELLESDDPFLNPVEVFVLGAAFLVHDLAHSRAALGVTDEDLSSNVLYCDCLAEVLASRTKPNSSVETGLQDDSANRKQALATFLRLSHGANAENLLMRSWLDSNDHEHYLLADDELRGALGEAIGRVAASHHWPVARLQGEFGLVGAPAFLPHSWNCDLFKLATIIRLADAAHIDSRRAPLFLAALRKPQMESKDHWEFQQRVHHPGRQGDRIVYTSGSSFPLPLANAWWLGFDTLNMIDHELREVDSLLIDTKRHRFAIKAVAGVEDPQRLVKLIPTQGWHPLDTQIRVSNVASLVSRLGGEQLYGENNLAPVRELIQNAADAVRARRVLEGHSSEWGLIEVALIHDKDNWTLQVTDSGVGMSQAVLTGSLLDFGSSFWHSSEAMKEHPGLKSKRFRSTGQYGIGFFSVFMLGRAVRVISRRYDLGANETNVLEFSDGTYARPLLRTATQDERKISGTRIEVALKLSPFDEGGLFRSESYDIPLLDTLGELCEWLCPASDVTIKTREADQEDFDVAVTANDWTRLSARDLVARTEKLDYDRQAEKQMVLARSKEHLRPMFSEEGVVTGRAMIRLESFEESSLFSDSGTVTVGGARSQEAAQIFGIVTGKSKRASRDQSSALASLAELQRWADEQRILVEARDDLEDKVKARVASVLRASGVSAGNLPIALSRSGWLTSRRITQLAKTKSEIKVVTQYQMRFGTKVEEAALAPNVLVINGDEPNMRGLFPESPYFPWADLRRHERTVEGLIISALSAAWKMDEALILSVASHSDREANFPGVVGTDRYGNPVVQEKLDIFRKDARKKKTTINIGVHVDGVTGLNH